MDSVGRFGLAVVSAMVLMAGTGVGISSAGLAGDATASKAKAKKFVPKKFEGIWKGTWTNHTFDTSGSASIRLKVKGSKKKPVMYGVFKLGGEAFGCDSAPPRPVKMKKGKGKNRWNAGGFNAAWNNGKGPIRITYNHRKGKISGSGFSPCAKEVTYSFTGRMNSRSARASTEIFINGEPFATSTLSMKRN